jgi:prepilin-type N-terminal cleavage/methylation domain-containing protein
MLRRRPRSLGFTLLEMLIVIAVIGILVALVMPNSNPTLHDQLRAAARILATDLAYGRSLAVGNGDKYQFTFDAANNRYILQYSGTNTALQNLPRSPFSSPGDPANQYIVALGNLPRLAVAVQLVGAATTGTSTQPVNNVEFGPLGATTNSSPTTIWLKVTSGPQTRYITVSINPVTGLADVGTDTGVAPPSGVGS